MPDAGGVPRGLAHRDGPWLGGELRHIAPHVGVERDTPFGEQHEQSAGRERLGHAADAEPRAVRHRDLLLEVGKTEAATPDQRAIAHDRHLRAGNARATERGLDQCNGGILCRGGGGSGCGGRAGRTAGGHGHPEHQQETTHRQHGG
jgi:hypothetical protein